MSYDVFSQYKSHATRASFLATSANYSAAEWSALGIENFVLPDPSVSKATLRGTNKNDLIGAASPNDNLYGNDGDDIIIGGDGSNYIDGGSGNDLLLGGLGSDSYMFSSGIDTISDFGGSSDKLYLRPSVKLSDLTFSAEGSDLIIADARLGSTVRIADHFGAGSIEWLRMGDGTLIDLRDGLGAVRLAPVAEPKLDYTAKNLGVAGAVGATASEKWLAGFGISNVVDLAGTSVRNFINGTDGSDFLRAGSANDLLFGGDGNDIIHGGSDRNYIDGGKGDDLLFGGAGDDSYMFSPGNDVIFDSSGDADKLYLRPNSNLADLRFFVDGSDLLIIDKGLDSSMRIADHFGAGRVEWLRLGDGTLLDLSNGNPSVPAPIEASAQQDTQKADPVVSDKLVAAAGPVVAPLDAIAISVSPIFHEWGGIGADFYRGPSAPGDTVLTLSAARGASLAGPGTNPNTAHVVKVALGTTAAELNAMIAGAEKGTTFVFAKGTYTFDQQITIRHGDVTLKGAGQGETVFVVTKITGADAIRVQAPWQKENFGSVQASEANLNTVLKWGAGENATSVYLESVANLKVGDFLEISMKNVPTNGDKYATFLGTMVEITEIDASTGEVTLARQVGLDLKAGATVRGIDLLRNVVLGDFTIDYGDAMHAVDPYRYVNNNEHYVGQPGMEAMGVRAIFLNSVTDSGVYNVTINNAGSNGLVVRGAVDITVNGLTVNGVQNLGDGGNGYGLEIGNSYFGNYENLVFTGLIRHAVTLSKDGSSAFNNVHVKYASANVDFHGGPDYKNIYYVEEMDLSQLKDDYAFSGVDYRDARNEGQNKVLFDKFTGADAVVITKVDPNYVATNYTGKDSIYSINNFSGARDDIIHGGNRGGSISTGAGNDMVHSGTGDDIIRTGTGKDTIFFHADSGNDIILDFDVRNDRISIDSNVNGSGIDSYEDLMARARDDGNGNIIVDLGGGNSVSIEGVALAELGMGNFLFL